MEIKEEVSYKLLCNACLCVGRKLYRITNEKAQRYYMNILDEIPLFKVLSVNLLVCWECKALLEKSLAFREQVQDSYRILQTYTNENLHECLLSQVTRPPRLKVHSIDPVSIVPDSTDFEEVPVICVKDEVKCEGWDSDKDEETNHLEDCPLTDSSESTKNLDSELQTIITSIKRDKKRKSDVKHKIKRAKKIVKSLSSKKKPKHENPDQKILTIELTYDELLQEREKESTREVYIKSEFKCESCLIGFNYKKSYQAHVTAKHSALTFDELLQEREKESTREVYIKSEYKCESCLIGFNYKKSYQAHVTAKHSALTYDELLQEREKESTREVYIKSEYKCESCLIGFNYKKSYQAHVTAKHSADLGEYICPICKTIISSVESFTAHYKRHMRRYECSICQKRTLDMKVMQQHYYSTHEISLKEYKCNLCGKISNSIDTHRYHRDTHKARVQCTECDKTFRHRAGLMNHRLAVHEYHNAFPCTICDKVFRWKTSLKRHLEKHEVKAKSSAAAAYCLMCNVTFASICSYQRHMKNSLKHVTQDQLKFICDHCNKRFADKTKLRDHIEEKHLHKTYQCHICLKPSKNRVGLDQHIRNVHKGRPNDKMCHHCGKGFPTKMQLESHIRTHTGERPFICEYCPTTFSQQSNLYKHYRQVHLNMKSKRYPICKRKDDKPQELPIPESCEPVDPYRPVTMLFSTDRGFVI